MSQQKTAEERINEKLPMGQMATLGLQHVLALYAGAIAVPLVIGGALGLNPAQMKILLAADLFTSGIATVVQSLGFGKHIGVKLPIMMGCAFSAVPVLIAVAQSGSITDMYGAIIFSGLFIILAAPIVGKLRRFFPPIVIGCVVIATGITLLPVGIKNAGGGSHLLGTEAFGTIPNVALAIFVMIAILLFNKYLKGFFHSISILLGLVIGTIVAAICGLVDFTPVLTSSWFGFVPPFAFGIPTFNPAAIVTLLILSLVFMIESAGTFMGVARICEKDLSDKEITAGLRAEGIGNILGAIFNAFPYMSFFQNIGIVSLTKITSRFVVVTGGCILIVLGLIPKVAAFATIIPASVFGGAMIIMFANVAVAGFNILRDVDLTKSSNMIVISLSLGVGVGTALVPDFFQHVNEKSHVFEMLFGHGGIILSSVIAMIANLFLNSDKEEKLQVHFMDDNKIVKEVR